MKKIIVVIIVIFSFCYLFFATDFFPRFVSLQYQAIRDCYVSPRNSVNDSSFGLKFGFNNKSYCILEAPQDGNYASQYLHAYWIFPRGFYFVTDYVGGLFSGKYQVINVVLINNDHFTLGKNNDKKQYVEERIKMFDRVGVVKLSERDEYINKNNIP